MAFLLDRFRDRPKGYLDYSLYKKAYKDNTLAQQIAKHYNTTIENVLALASDPDHGGKSTLSSFIETMVALELEQEGIMGLSIARGIKETDLIDGWDRMWDVKTPPTLLDHDFDIEVKKSVQSIVKKLNKFPNGNLGILLCVSFLSKEDLITLSLQLKPLLSENQRFLIRMVHVNGVL